MLPSHIFCKTYYTFGQRIEISPTERGFVLDGNNLAKELVNGDIVRIHPGQSVLVLREEVAYPLSYQVGPRRRDITIHAVMYDPLRFIVQLRDKELTLNTLFEKLFPRETQAALKPILKSSMNAQDLMDILCTTFDEQGFILKRVLASQTPLASDKRDPELQLCLSETGTFSIDIDFAFEGKRFQATLHVPKKQVVGASHTKRALGGTPLDYDAFTLDKSQCDFYKVMVAYFQEIKSTYSLSQNDYVNLLRCYVQSLKYDSKKKNRKSPQYFPIETATYGAGVCSDTALLLCGLLSESGFDTAYIVFPGDKHGVAGVGVEYGEGAWGGNYAVIDTTTKNRVGYVNPSLTSLPVTHKIGSGTLRYAMDED